MKRRVVITGLGAISGLGLDVSSFWKSLQAGRSAIEQIHPVTEDDSIYLGATVRDLNPEKYFTEDENALLDRFSQLAVIAAKEALEDADLVCGGDVISQAAAIIGSGCGGKHTDEVTYNRLYQQNKSRVHPLTIPKGMPSAAVSMVSTHLGIKGPAFTISSACASGAHAVIQGCAMIQSGMNDIAVVGASDAPFTYGLLKSWEALRVMSSDTCRPFCADRSGIVLGEGAGMLVLESEEHAKQRGVRIYAELAGYGMSSDAGHITRPDVKGINAAIINALSNSELNHNQVDYINAHGTATQANDITETQAINQVFGEHAEKLAVSSTKAMHGHALGASSAIEAVVTTLALYHGVIPPTVNFTTAGDKCNLDYVPNKSRKKEIKVAMSNSFAFGGLNAVLALRSAV